MIMYLHVRLCFKRELEGEKLFVGISIRDRNKEMPYAAITAD
jgi:hypothetical protein